MQRVPVISSTNQPLMPIISKDNQPLMPMNTNLAIVKEWIKAGKAEVQNSGCILWVKAKTTSGYGHLRYEGKVKQAHRIVLEHQLGRPIGENMKACHTCNNPACVNENHLYEGTQADNMRDMRQSNRAWYPKGGKHGRAKLNEQQVLEIREKLTQGKTICSIASEYGVSKSTIGYIKTNQTWLSV
jgi:hypothetical protein